ncbi:MAG: ABC transporter ATP-binding protein [Spirochaetales bacterium]|nr:ABC transporter ATP-binding protein [Spirochaetales bacterium]
MMIIECSHIAKHYIAPDGNTKIPVLRDISLSVKKGESVAILGPSGSGKSTLLHILGLLDYPSSGSVSMAGRDVTHVPAKDRDQLRNLEIGFVFQLHYLLPQCTVLENILIPTIPKGNSLTAQAALDRGHELLRRVGLGSRLHHRPWQLSGGELQRVAFVRALINSPGLLLADEPTGALDHRTSETLIKVLLDLNKEEQVSLIIVTHAVDFARMMERVFVLEDGELSAT